MNIAELKQKSGTKLFASVLGKSTIDAQSQEYKTIEEATKILLTNGFGIIHGGYAGGAMSATSDTANVFIKENNLSPEWNIGVPQVEHDGLWERVADAAFADVAEDIFQRLKVVVSGDIAIICPLGGDGTELEETIIFHENVVYGRGENPKPLIYLQTPNGTNWKALIETKMKILDISVKNPSDYNWLYFIDSIDQFQELIKKLKSELLP